MGRLEETGWPWRAGSAQTFDELQNEHWRAQGIYDLRGLERQAVLLLAEYRIVSKVASLMGMGETEVRRLIFAVMHRLGVKRFYQLYEMVRIAQAPSEVTPAAALYHFIQRRLVGAVVRGAVMQDQDWTGLLLTMPDGAKKVAWLLDSREGDASSCWVQMEDD